MSKRKYLLFPGHVINSAGEREYINAFLLAELCRIDMNECAVRPDNFAEWMDRDLIHLYPDPDGEYELHSHKGHQYV